jgi:hypothetical protein
MWSDEDSDAEPIQYRDWNSFGTNYCYLSRYTDEILDEDDEDYGYEFRIPNSPDISNIKDYSFTMNNITFNIINKANTIECFIKRDDEPFESFDPFLLCLMKIFDTSDDNSFVLIHNYFHLYSHSDYFFNKLIDYRLEKIIDSYTAYQKITQHEILVEIKYLLFESHFGIVLQILKSEFDTFYERLSQKVSDEVRILFPDDSESEIEKKIDKKIDKYHRKIQTDHFVCSFKEVMSFIIRIIDYYIRDEDQSNEDIIQIKNICKFINELCYYLRIQRPIFFD